ncbi:MAG: Gfo/Idh/MocA family oxidoreductase [Oscillospiraceae bacterium]
MLKYALIGCGRISPNHIAAAIANSDEVSICAICDIDTERIDIIKSQFNLENVKTYTDYHRMLAEVRPDLVAIATFSGEHAKIALDCINCKANVIIEKPIALSMEDADKILLAAKINQVKVCACHQNRFNKSIQKMREAVESQRFGKLFHATAHIRWNRGKEYYDQAKWRGKWSQDGGALMNQCIHNIDLLRWMMGDEIDEVFAYTDRLNHDYIEAEDLGMALVKFRNGAYGIIEGTTNVYPKNLEETLYIFGEKGTVKAGGKSVNIIEEWRFADEIDNPEQVKTEFSEAPKNVYGFGHTPLYKNVIDSINIGTPLLVDGEAGKRALELVLAIYKSAAEGHPVKLPLLDTKSIDFTGRF